MFNGARTERRTEDSSFCSRVWVQVEVADNWKPCGNDSITLNPGELQLRWLLLLLRRDVRSSTRRSGVAQPEPELSGALTGRKGSTQDDLVSFLSDLSWLNWCLTGSCLFSLVLILFFRESYDRLYLDVFVSV